MQPFQPTIHHSHLYLQATSGIQHCDKVSFQHNTNGNKMQDGVQQNQYCGVAFLA